MLVSAWFVLSAVLADPDVVEHAERRLVQLDVSVEESKAAAVPLGPEDFSLDVGDRTISELLVDRVCAEEGGDEPSSIPTTFFFYFDQPFMTFSGRNSAFQTARELVPKLIHGGSRGLVLSNGRRTKTYGELTEDPKVLLAALDKAERDLSQWDAAAYANLDPTAMIVSSLDEWQATRSYWRLGLTLGRLVNVEPPKAILYFSDFSAPGGFSDPVVREANAHAVRVYAIRSDVNELVKFAGSEPIHPWTASSLAASTGGLAFRYTSTSAMARLIARDLECFYLLSFDARELPENETLHVRLSSRRPGVRLRTRSSVIVPDASSALTARLLGAFAAPELVRSNVPVRGAVLPTDFRDGSYRALVQVTVEGSTLRDSIWDLGGSLLARHGVPASFAARISARAPGIPIVLEQEIAIPPGGYELVMVAHETNQQAQRFDLIATGVVEDALPAIPRGAVTIGPIGLVQPGAGVFVRDGQVRESGSLIRPAGAPARADLPLALVTLLCASDSIDGLSAHSRLIAPQPLALSAQPLEIAGGTCVQLRDVIPSGTLGAATVQYEIRVLRGDKEVAVRTRELAVAAPEANLR